MTSTIFYSPIKDVHPGDYVLSLDQKAGKLVPAKILALLDMGWRPTFKLTTEDGCSVVTTSNHPYLTKEGWKKVIYLKIGDEITVVNDGLFSQLFSQKVNHQKNGNRHQKSKGIATSKEVGQISHRPFSFLTTITEIKRNVKEENNPNIKALASTFAPNSGKKYPATVERKIALATSKQKSERILYWGSDKESFLNINSNNITNDVKFVKIISIKPAGIRHVWERTPGRSLIFLI